MLNSVGKGVSTVIGDAKNLYNTGKSDIAQIGQAAKGRMPFSLQGTYKKAKRK